MAEEDGGVDISRDLEVPLALLQYEGGIYSVLAFISEQPCADNDIGGMTELQAYVMFAEIGQSDVCELFREDDETVIIPGDTVELDDAIFAEGRPLLKQDQFTQILNVLVNLGRDDLISMLVKLKKDC